MKSLEECQKTLDQCKNNPRNELNCPFGKEFYYEHGCCLECSTVETLEWVLEIK